MSPRRSSGVRELATMMASTDGSIPAASASRTGGITRPSCSSSRAPAGIEPAVMPPTSAWWARVTAWATTESPTAMGDTMVRSGRWVPPVKGSFRIHASPGRAPACITACTASGIAPRCTGMESAWATMLPRASKIAVLQSLRSLIVTLNADLTRAACISSATARSAALHTRRPMGSRSLIRAPS